MVVDNNCRSGCRGAVMVVVVVAVFGNGSVGAGNKRCR